MGAGSVVGGGGPVELAGPAHDFVAGVGGLAQVDCDAAGGAVDAAHERELVVALREMGLVDADCVYPEGAVRVGVAETVQGCLAVDGDGGLDGFVI